MSRADPLQSVARALRRRRTTIALLGAAPILLALVFAAARLAGASAAIPIALVGILCCAGLAISVHRRTDAAWLARRLDARVPAMEDSATLLSADAGALSPLQRLQRARLAGRIAQLDIDRVRDPWPLPPLLAGLGLALAIALGAWLHHPAEVPGMSETRDRPARAASITALDRIGIAIQPPAYTGVAAHEVSALDFEAPEGSRVDWRLRFVPQPRAAALVFHDGRRLALDPDGTQWHVGTPITTSLLYRIEVEGVAPADASLHRVDVIPDRAPEIRVIHPERTLSLLEAGQKHWNLEFEASDDYGLAAAGLALTLAQGSGESVAFKDRSIALDGEPVDGQRRVRYQVALDLDELGLGEGDDLVVKLAVRDTRKPEANVTRSASFILRWPAEASADSAGLEGVLQRTLPAYFRSQRQIIIDSEALLAERDSQSAERFLDRADAIGVDQKILRLRYGQFLGEESEGEQHAGGAHEDHGDAAVGEAPAGFGQAGDVLAEFGHVHDIAEAATLLDPETKETLRSALGEMWQAELHLRQGDPDLALPFEHRALELIKEVQQSTRIYLARVGLELPQVDESRRLSGDRSGLSDRIGALVRTAPDEQGLADFWAALASEGGELDAVAVRHWLDRRGDGQPETLTVLAAIDRLQRDSACSDCRAQIRKLLWPLLPTPATGVAPHAVPDVAGRSYLEAVQATGGAR
ncbi:MAG: DUF4175 family protein [Xanthomonadales bacterium]|nr:DUF4175 family protein [Xanthomonadales bacterium]